MLKCPHCEYEPLFNELDYCDAPGRFYTLDVEAKRDSTGEWYDRGPEREKVYGCPACGIMFMNMGYSV